MATLALGAGILGTSLFVGCGDDFNPTDSSSDAGNDATGGTGGNDSGADAPVACTRNEDCDDGDPCNGSETCDDSKGVCAAGAAPCAAPSDPAHCVIACSVVSGAAQCGTETAADADGDGHGDAECASAPGDDCDDGNDKVYPGATETCDGLDGDCDGVRDIDEGLPLSGQPFTIAGPLGEDATRPRAAWIASAERLGVVWELAGVEARFDVLDATGTAVGSTIELAPAQFDQHGVTIASDGTQFAVAWAGEITGGSQIYLQLFDPEGVAKGAATPIGGPVDFDAEPAIYADSNGFTVAWKQRHSSGNFDEGMARRLDSNGAPITGAVQLTSAPEIYNPSIAANSSSVASLFLWSGAGLLNNEIRLTLLDDSLADVTAAPLTPAVNPPQQYQHPKLLSVTTGYFGVWSSANVAAGTLHVTEVSPTGSTICGPVSSSTFADGANVGRAIVAGDTRLISLYENHDTAAAKVTLARFDDQCNELNSVDVVGAAVQPSPNGLGDRIDVTVGDRIAVVWDEIVGANARVRGRIFGKNLCD